jgi:Ca-activated chloride channel family protein
MTLHFLRPYWFFTMIPICFLCFRLSKLSLADNWRLVCDKHLLSCLLILPNKKIKLRIFLLFLACMLAILALAGPSWKKQAQAVYRTELGSVIVLNLSPSMGASIGATKKIEKARFKILDYLQRLREGQTGLIVYADEAHTISPLTEDAHTLANFVPALDPTIMPTFNDDTQIGLKEAEKLFKQAGLHNGNIILVTDKITHFSEVKQVAEGLYEQGYRLLIFDVSGELDSSNEMRLLAHAGGGKLIPLTPNNQDIEELLAETKLNFVKPPTKKMQEKGLIWQDSGHILVFLLLPLALFAFRRGNL